MFTGLIEEVGTVAAVKRHPSMADFTIDAHVVTADIAIGDSLAVNGACLTVVSATPSSVTVQAVEETLARTTLSSFRHGTRVNLERAMRLDARLGGHIVQGHVDTTGRVVSRRGTENVIFTIAHDTASGRYIVEKGSIAIDGVSLTVTHARSGEFGVSVIPHSLTMTTLATLDTGATVNLETDIIAKYVEKLTVGQSSGLTLDTLKTLGYQ